MNRREIYSSSVERLVERIYEVLKPIDPELAPMVTRMLSLRRSDDLESKLLDLLYERPAGEAAVGGPRRVAPCGEREGASSGGATGNCHALAAAPRTSLTETMTLH